MILESQPKDLNPGPSGASVGSPTHPTSTPLLRRAVAACCFINWLLMASIPAWRRCLERGPETEWSGNTICDFMSRYTAAGDFYSACFTGAAESSAPPPDGSRRRRRFRLSALHLHCALKHLHPFNLQQNSFALLHFSQGLMHGGNYHSRLPPPCGWGGANRFIPSVRCNIIHQFYQPHRIWILRARWDWWDGRYYPSRLQRCEKNLMKKKNWKRTCATAVVVFFFYGINVFSPCAQYLSKGDCSRTASFFPWFFLFFFRLCPFFCSAPTSPLWLKCKAKQPTLLYISQPVPADMCSLKHFWARDTSLVCSVLLEEEGGGGGSGGGGGRGRERVKKKMSAIFSFTVAESVTFFDISTEGLVLQQRLPDALIDSAVSNRKRNKCFIELELSLVIAVGKGEGLGARLGGGS